MNVRRFRALAASVGIAGLVAVGPSTLAGMALTRQVGGRGTPRAGTASSTPVLVAGSYRGRRPRTIAISGDGGNIVTGLRWSEWAATRATGKGTSDIQGCVPNCASGTETPVTTSIKLSRPVHGYFTKLTERRDGQTETFTYTPGHAPDNWPSEAS